MTEAGPGTADESSVDTSLPIVHVRELLLTLSKALRAAQLYEPNNPVYKRFVAALTTAVTDLWDEVDSLVLTVEEDQLTADGVQVYQSSNRSESLAFLLFKDGVRLITFTPGFEEEIRPFLTVLNKARHARQDDDDLLTLLWEADLRSFAYRYVDLLAEGVAVPEAGEGADAAQLAEAFQDVQQEASTEGGASDGREPPETVRPEDFNPTLYALDRSEMNHLREEIRKEVDRDVRGDVLNALFDRIEESVPGRRGEIFEILRGLLPAFLARGEMIAATQVLQELRGLEAADVFDRDDQQRLTTLLDRLSAPDTINELVDALEVGALSPSAKHLGAFLGFLRAGALGTLLRAAETIEARDLRRVLSGAVAEIAASNARAVVHLLHVEDPVVVAAAARIVGRNGIVGAAEDLRELFYHEDADVRRAAVEAAGSLRSATLASALIETLLDLDADVRIAGARALGSLQYRPAAVRFREVIGSREIRQADRTEKIAVFEAYGALGDPEAPEILDRILNGKSFLGRREPPEIRACAALALGKIGSEEARRTLQKAEGEDDPVVRSAVSRALRPDEEVGP